jgi:hypothetical protein
MEKHLHIVCLDVPYPVDYGGVFDLYYKIRTLHELGIKIHLHCFEYGRGEQTELSYYCEEVNYYHRKEGHKGFSHKYPYIVCSRSNIELLENLLKDNDPIFLEGIHCTYLLNDKRFGGRKIFLRLHNIEYKYYRQLFNAEKGWIKKFYYWHESNLLRKYENEIANKAKIIVVSRQDADCYRKEFSAKNIEMLPVFLPFKQIESGTGNGCFCLYHGNLSISENESAALWLLGKVFNDLAIPLVIAGKNPSSRLQKMAQKHPFTCLEANPTQAEMQDMIAKAQINILPSFNNTGIKLKLLNALFNGRHCVVNEQTVGFTGLDSLCHICSDEMAFKEIIRNLFVIPFRQEEITAREKILPQLFNNEKNGKQLIEWIW